MKKRPKNDGLFKRKRADKTTGRQTESRCWYFRYRDHKGIVRMVRGASDKSATEYQKAQLVSRAEQIRQGLIAAEVLEVNKPLSEHLEAWRDSLKAQGKTAAYTQVQYVRAGRLFELCQARFWKDITASRVERAICDLKTSSHTRAYYTQAVKQFCRWMMQRGNATQNPLEYLKRPAVTEVKTRAAFEPQELCYLLQRTRAAGASFGIDGQSRALLYQFAAQTGFRANEIRCLKVRDFDFGNLVVTLDRSFTKNGKEAALPLRAETAADLKDAFRCKMPDAQAFAMPSEYRLAGMLRADIAAARLAWVNEAGRDVQERQRREKDGFLVFDQRGMIDFHSFRHTFGTMLAASGVHPKTAQDLMRHSDINLTMSRYTHTLRGQAAAAVASLPNFSIVEVAEADKTGTV